VVVAQTELFFLQFVREDIENSVDQCCSVVARCNMPAATTRSRPRPNTMLLTWEETVSEYTHPKINCEVHLCTTSDVRTKSRSQRAHSWSLRHRMAHRKHGHQPSKVWSCYTSSPNQTRSMGKLARIQRSLHTKRLTFGDTHRAPLHLGEQYWQQSTLQCYLPCRTYLLSQPGARLDSCITP
jgi:hypothetical protein